MTLTRISFTGTALHTKIESLFKVSSLGIVLEKMPEYLKYNETGNSVSCPRPTQLEVCNVLADSPQTLQRTTYLSAYDLLTELPGKLVVLNGINVPRKLQRFPPTTVYEATQVYRTQTGEWRLVCERFHSKNPGSVVVPVTCLLLLQTPIPLTPAGYLRIEHPAPIPPTRNPNESRPCTQNDMGDAPRYFEPY
jgi:hypothetical protein